MQSAPEINFIRQQDSLLDGLLFLYPALTAPKNCKVPLNKNIPHVNPVQEWVHFQGGSALADLPLRIKHIVWVCVWASWEPHRECVGERERTLSDIAHCDGGTNWSQTGQGTRPKTTSPTDWPQHGPWERAERRGYTYGLETGIEKKTHGTDIFPNDRFESKAAHFRLLKSCLVVDNGTELSY